MISKCFGFDRCRWNGTVIPDEFVESLKPHVGFQLVCTEMKISLGVPRDPIRIVDSGRGPRLIQADHGGDPYPLFTVVAGAKEIWEKGRIPHCGLTL